jgi:hypothetical protein
MESHKTRNENNRKLSTEFLSKHRTQNSPIAFNRLKLEYNVTIEVPDSTAQFINTKAHYLSQSRELVRRHQTDLVNRIKNLNSGLD